MNDCNCSWTEKEKNAVCKTQEKDLTVLDDIQWHLWGVQCRNSTYHQAWRRNKTKLGSQSSPLVIDSDCWMYSTCFVYIPASSCTAVALSTEMLYYQFNKGFRIFSHVSLLKPYWLTFSRRKVCFQVLCPPLSRLHNVCVYTCRTPACVCTVCVHLECFL